MKIKRSTPFRQRGLGMLGFLFVAIVLVLVAIFTMRLVPAYVEFFSIKRALIAMGQESDFRTKSNAEIRNDFAKRAGVDRITVIGPTDLSIERSGGVPVISTAYEFRTKLVGNVSVVVDFSASSDPATAPVQVE